MPLVATTAVEVVPLRRLVDGGIEVWVHEREPDDFYKGEVGTTGSVLRGTDSEGEGTLAFRDAILHVLRGELGVNASQVRIYPAGEYNAHTPRCPHLHRIFVAILNEGPTKPGMWVPVEHLPDNFIDHLRVVVQIAVGKFREMPFEEVLSL